MLKSASLAAKFLLELAVFAALAYWGAATGHGAWAVAAAMAAPVAAVIVRGLAAAGAVTLCCTSGRGDSAGILR
jgi:altronate dehydratase